MWIEINAVTIKVLGRVAVTSLAEVWIEIRCATTSSAAVFVTSLAEVWIEMMTALLKRQGGEVTSLAEVWIEICVPPHYDLAIHTSLPLRKCGLKSVKIQPYIR